MMKSLMIFSLLSFFDLKAQEVYVMDKIEAKSSAETAKTPQIKLNTIEEDLKNLTTNTFNLLENISAPKLVSFTGTTVSDDIYLLWDVAYDFGRARYELQKSLDGVFWWTVDEISVKRSSINRYVSVDVYPESGENYYRLKMVDQDSSYQYSNWVEVVYYPKTEEARYFIYPNPSNGIVHLLANGTLGSNAEVKLMDELGRPILSQLLSKGDNVIKFNRQSNGLYFLQVRNGEDSHIFKVILER